MDWHPVISVQQQTPDNDFCHFSISNVRFAFWAFFRKPEKLGSHTRSKWWLGDSNVKGDPNDPLTRWSNDPVPCLIFMCGSSKVIKMVPFDRRHNLLFFVPAEVYAYIEPFRGPWVAGMHSIQRHVVKIWSATHRTRPRGTSRVSRRPTWLRVLC